MLETDLFGTFITILSTIIEWIVLRFLLNEISKLKKSKIQLNISLAIAAIVILILTVIEFNINIKLFICIMITYLIYFYNYEVDNLKCLLISLLYWLLLIGFDSIGLSIVGFINDVQDMSKLLDNNFFTLELIIISKSLLILLIPMVKVVKLEVSSVEKKDYLYLNVPILANIISIIIIFGYIFNDKDINNTENIIILIISIVLLFSNISLVGIIGRIIKDNKIRAEYEITKEKMNIQYKYYLNLQESQEKIKKLYHDMNNHIICIQNIYGNHELSNKYIKDINNQIKDCRSIFDTKSIILDIILNEKKSICDKNDINFLVDINFSKCGFIEITDICSIFSNMLDNAIEACNKITDGNINKKIKLRGTIINKFFVIKCENTKVNNINLRKNKLITDKGDSFLHGIGVNSVKSSVEKYNGNVEIISNENNFTMIIYIPIERI
ncbi:ATP-binding protein [Paraclostridium sordellii 8483]|uniref:ATP-binding protein n=1 Tax=Paraclostridium sordellii TaxID=1505 RepID=UPI00031E45DB|nr:ATP-binding protein [Paeniclostridium sordellii]TAN67701.1 ATP-binding protein [Paeniclostridium sordellii 8483]